MRELAVETSLSAILARGNVEAGFRAASPEDAVDQLLRPVLLAEGFSPEAAGAALSGIRNRERSGSTAFGAVALPHARVGGLGRIVAALGANASGVYDSGPSGVRVVLAFASPASATVPHLQFLAQVARLLRQEETVAALLGATDPAGLLEAIRRRER
ncbi:MAG: PTS sugar transporter subunit IIA [Holophagales bacterium]|jgi:PTS system nitrogen regulatory IIA component|nr:PTS sugar transporter subunit IIA [Holophagales bacterium]MBK9967520.1 PTS sugar transporter subunit IIA [Holophagales bacterium]